jgi:hypothetical protein
VLLLAAATVTGCEAAEELPGPRAGDTFVTEARFDPALMQVVPDVVPPGGELEAARPVPVAVGGHLRRRWCASRRRRREAVRRDTITELRSSGSSRRLADVVLWRPAWFGAKPETALKGRWFAWGAWGEGNASVRQAQPARFGPHLGGEGPRPRRRA